MVQEDINTFRELYNKLKNETFYVLQVINHQREKQYVPKEVHGLTKKNLYEICTYKHVFHTYEEAQRKADELNHLLYAIKKKGNYTPVYIDDPEFNIPDECILD